MSETTDRKLISWRIDRLTDRERALINEWADNQTNIQQSLTNIVLHVIKRFGGDLDVMDFEVQRRLFEDATQSEPIAPIKFNPAPKEVKEKKTYGTLPHIESLKEILPEERDYLLHGAPTAPLHADAADVEEPNAVEPKEKVSAPNADENDDTAIEKSMSNLETGDEDDDTAIEKSMSNLETGDEDEDDEIYSDLEKDY